MKSFKDLLAESHQDKKFAKTVDMVDRGNAGKGQIGTLHFAHGADYDVYAPDSHDLAYFGKGVVRLKGKTTGRTTAAYLDWNKGTVSFYSGDPTDDLKFEKPAKFKKAGFFKEAEENLDLYNQLAEDFEINLPMDESLVAGSVYALSGSEKHLMYTGRTNLQEGVEKAVFSAVDAQGRLTLTVESRFVQEYTGDLSKAVLTEAKLTKTSPNVKKVVTALKKKFDVEVEAEDKKVWNKTEERYEYSSEVKIEYYEKGEDSEPVGTFVTTDGEKFKFGHVYSKARADHNKEFDANHIVSAVKSGHYDPQ